MNILIHINDKYIKPAIVMLYSLFTTNPEPMNIYAAADEDKENAENRELTAALGHLKAYVESWEEKRLIVVSKADVGEHFAAEDVHRILYLDTDIIVKSSLKELYYMDMTRAAISTCEDMYSLLTQAGNMGRHSLVSQNDYVLNAGVTLINIDELETSSDISDVLEWQNYDTKQDFFEKYAAKCIYISWDIYNVTPSRYLIDKELAASGVVAFADERDTAGLSEGDIQAKYTDITRQLANKAVIIHYAGTSKPWNSYRKETDISEYVSGVFDDYYISTEEKALGMYNKLDGVKAYETSLPILIYYGEEFCYNIPNNMLMQLEAAFNRCGIRTVSYNSQKEGTRGLVRFLDRSFRAIIDVQGYLFQVKMSKDEYIHDRIHGPKYNMVLDHPVWLANLLNDGPKDYYVLTHDRNYRAFIKKYYRGVKEAYIIPPAADHELVRSCVDYDNRSIDVAFIGTYGDYKAKEAMINEAQPQVRDIAWRFTDTLRAKPWLTFEAGFKETLTSMGISMTDEEFFDVFSKMKPAFHYMTYYTRFRIIEALVNNGITVNVWGSSWKKSELYGDKHLVVHDDIKPEECMDILRDAKISINIMAWHKDGFTERMANSMAAGAVLLTDETTYDDKELCAGVNYMPFGLNDLDGLVTIINELLTDDNRRKTIAANGRRYACGYATWDNRAKALLEYSKTEDEDGTEFTG